MSIDKTKEQASKHLGTVSVYTDQYDKTLLVPVERTHNRTKYNIEETNLPFVGFDTWNAFEISFQLKNGLPIAAMAKISYPCDTHSIIESKSLKLYLNSYNMTKFDLSKDAAIEFVAEQIAKDLTEVLGGDVSCKLFTNADDGTEDVFDESDFIDIERLVQSENIVFDQYNESPDILKKGRGLSGLIAVKTSLLRSNCRITNQPDWGDVYIYMDSKSLPTLESLLQYIVSFRRESHFHEECCEMLFKRLFDKFAPEDLMVTCFYTRRGGVDINPARATSEWLLPKLLGDTEVLTAKQFRQ